ncbi:MAG: ATP-binding protein [Candidatus Moraniibacteriota bacterium]
MFEKYITEQNTHWQEGFFASGFSREVTTKLEKLVATRQILAILGVRRSGKSTVSKQLINYLIKQKKVNPRNILFLNLEDPFLYALREDPNNLQKIFEQYLLMMEPQGKVFVFLDEIQFFEGWQVFVKAAYEKGKIKFFITGSNSQLLSQEMATLLSGRSIAKNIFPFNFGELLGVKNVAHLEKFDVLQNALVIEKIFKGYIKDGGFPEVVLEKKNEIKKELLINYYKNILYQDIIPRFEIKKTQDIENLLLYLFSNIGNGYSYNSLGEYLKIHDKTVKEYISFFEKSFLLFEISNYQYSIKKQENFPKKVYAVDNGFINAVSFAFSENYGRLLENLVFIKLLQAGKKVYYSKGKHECDFVIKQGLKISQAIQVTKQLDAQTEKREMAGLLEAMEKFDLKEGYLLTKNQEEERKIGKKTVHILPVWKWMLIE